MLSDSLLAFLRPQLSPQTCVPLFLSEDRSPWQREWIHKNHGPLPPRPPTPAPTAGRARLSLVFVLHRDSDSVVSASGTWGGSAKVICTQDPEAVREPSPALDGRPWSLYGRGSGADRRDSGSWAPVRSPLRLSFPGDLTLNPREGRMERRRSHVQTHAGRVVNAE